jgi:divalent anion:Na+ symporter, DASS family
MNSKVWKLGICILVAVVLLLLPAPAGLSPVAWQLFAVYLAAILGLVLRPFDEAVILLGVIAAAGLAFGNMGALLSGYASSVAWLVFSAFMIGAAFSATGLGRRIAFLLISKFGRTTLRLAYVAAVTDLVISPATPSNTARTGGIVYPIFQSIAVALDSKPGPTARRIGAYLTLTLYYISFTTGYTFLTAMAPNVLILSFAKSIMKVQVDWMLWATAAIVPGLVTLFLIPWVVYKIYPPEIKKIDNETLGKKGLAELGPISRREITLAVLFVLAILGWALGSVLKIDATAVAVGFVAACLLTGVMTWDNVIAYKGAWSTFIWYGGIIGFADALSKANFFVWLTKLIAANVDFTGIPPLAVLAALVLFCLAIRYLFASQAAYVAAMMPVLFSIALVAKVPLLPATFLIAFAAGYGGMLTHYGGALSPVLFGMGYIDQGTWWRKGAIMALISFVTTFVFGFLWWNMIGIW